MKAQQGDEKALEEILTRFLPAVKKYSRIMGYEQEDAVQDLREVLIKVIKPISCQRLAGIAMPANLICAGLIFT